MAEVFFLGFGAMLSQILLLRELLVQLSGNELAISFILGSWLFWTAVGNFLTSFLKKNILKDNTKALSISLSFAAVLPPLLLFAARFIRPAWGLLPGEILDTSRIMITCFLLMAPIGLVLGGMFVLYLVEELGKGHDYATGRIYIVEALGASMGGIVFSFLLVPRLNNFQAALMLAVLNLALVVRIAHKRLRLFAACLVFIVVSLAIVLIIKEKNPYPDWPGYQVIEEMDSRYGRLVVTSRFEGDLSFFVDRHLLVSIPDLLSAEETVHWAGLQHNNLEKALLIGGIGQAVGEVLKYPHISKVTLVELDSKLIELAKRRFPEKTLQYLEDERVEIVNSDGRLYINNTGEKYDLVLVNMPDAVTANLNRFYTVEFFNQVGRILKKDGIFSFRVTGAQNFYRQARLILLKSLKKSLERTFKQTLLIPGESVVFIASNRVEPLLKDSRDYLRQISEKNIKTSYVSAAYIPARLEPGRISDFNRTLENTKKHFINRDFYPLAYYYNLIIQSEYFDGSWGKTLNDLVPLNPVWLWLLIGLIIVVMAVLKVVRKVERPLWLGFTVFCAGFYEISTELLIILALQIFYGNVYEKIGLILACFMIGLALGGLLSQRLIRNYQAGSSEKNSWRHYHLTQAAICLYPLLVIAALNQMNSAIAYPVLSLLNTGLGFLAGVQFPLAARIISAYTKKESVTGGILNGIDLLGSTIGASLLLSFMVPLVGINQSLLFLSGLNIAATIFLFQAVFLNSSDIS